MRSARNKTIDIDVAEGRDYLNKCIRCDKRDASAAVELSDILDKTVIGDSFKIMPLLPQGFADLIIADPPYNMDKDFDGKSFRKSSDSDYAAYTEEWLSLVCPLLKAAGSLYICCDWRSSAVIYDVLQRHLKVDRKSVV